MVHPKSCPLAATLLLGAALLLPSAARADEGMWLFNEPPHRQLQERYQFRFPDGWLEHLQLSAVRFNNGGSGSFVSADGLVMTNHHVASDLIQQLSGPGQDLLAQGFLARTRAEERKVPNLELNVLVGIEDVTARVAGAVKPGMSGEEAEKARRAAMNEIEKESFDRTGLRSDVVTLFRGGAYHLYRSKRYTDVRLVFAPEQDIAFFGGDADNFEFPRYDLDVTFLRAYEDGRPARVEHFLDWSPEGSREGDLVFVAGHPGHTDRLDTVAHLEYLRDVEFPWRLDVIRRREVNLLAWSGRGPEFARQAKDELFGYQNARKARLGGLEGLQEPGLMARKRDAERALREAVSASPALKAKYGDPWEEISRTVEVQKRFLVPYRLVEAGYAFDTVLFDHARTLVRLAAETARPQAERLREFSESNLESIRLDLFSEAPIYPDFEEDRLADSLSLLMEALGPDDPLVARVLAGKSPRERARELVKGTKLADVAERRRLAEGGEAALKASSDPMVQLALLVDGPARQVRKAWETQVEEPQQQAYGRIAQAAREVGGADVYPDATFTLRLAFGQVKGYDEVPWRTTMGGTFAHAEAHGGAPGFVLPESWRRARGRIAADTPFNTVNTADIIGGNSGSPVVDRQGRLVGLIFDGNIESMVLDFQYTDRRARAVAVDSRALVEALRKVYGAEELLREILDR